MDRRQQRRQERRKIPLTSDYHFHRIGGDTSSLGVVRRASVEPLMLVGHFVEEQRSVGQQLDAGLLRGIEGSPVFGPGCKLQRRRGLNVALDDAGHPEGEVLPRRRECYTSGNCGNCNIAKWDYRTYYYENFLCMLRKNFSITINPHLHSTLRWAAAVSGSPIPLVASQVNLPVSSGEVDLMTRVPSGLTSVR